MRKLSLLPFFFIQIFAEGGDGGTGAGTATGQSDAAFAQPQTGAKQDLSEVQYGLADEPSAAGEDKVVDRSAEFKKLIKGDYKDEFEAYFKDAISKRLKGTEAIVARYNELIPTLELLAEMYGVDAEDIQALNKAIQDDETFYEDEALESGLTVQQVKEIRQMKRENEALKAQMEEANTQKQADALYASWIEQAKQVKQIYPGFDLQTELQNEQFQNLLRSNIPIQTAFEVIHRDEIIPAAMQYTAKKVEQKVADSIRSGKSRPAESAMGNRSSAVYKSDVSQLTDADMAEINRRVMRGERIRF